MGAMETRNINDTGLKMPSENVDALDNICQGLPQRSSRTWLARLAQVANHRPYLSLYKLHTLLPAFFSSWTP
jgi:hypothetical protein